MAWASSIARELKARTRGSARMRSAVAPVSAETGFTVMLPQSLYQRSRRTSALSVTSKPAARSISPTAATRAEAPPAGSPTISPLPITCRTRPGSGVAQLAWTTPPRTRSYGTACVTTPPGSTLSRGSSPSAVPWPNHHGTPFMNGSTTVSSPSSGGSSPTTSGRAGAFTARTTTSWGPSSVPGGRDARRRRGERRRRSRAASRGPRSAASVRPRAIALTSAAPVAASRAPSQPPIAPAPITHTFTGPP